MAHPWVVDGGDGFQIWRVAANILNKQSLTAKKGCFSSSEVGWGLTTPHHKKSECYKMLCRDSDTDNLWNNLDNRKWTGRPRYRGEDITTTDLGEKGGKLWTGFIWLRKGRGSGLL
jgi:hypothetical protein